MGNRRAALGCALTVALGVAAACSSDENVSASAGGNGGQVATGGTGGALSSGGSGGFGAFGVGGSGAAITGGSGGVVATGGSSGADASATGGSGGSATGGGSSVGGTGGVSGAAGASGGTGGGTGGTGGGTGGTGGGTGGTGGGTGGSGGGTGGTGGSGGTTCFAPVTDFAAAGPFTTTNGAGGTTCTIFRPATLGTNGCKHPIIIWGNGTTASPTTYQAALAHWASHGFIVAAANTSNAGTGTEMIGCLDWVLQQNATSGSAYFGNVDPDHVGASGHSQGGGGTIMAGRDARITVTAPLEPYTQQGFGGFDQASIGQQHGAMFLLSGAADNIATPQPNQQRVYDGVNVPVFWGTLSGADHIVSGTGNLDGFRGPMTAWFRLHLMGDESARSLFYGASCGLCTNASWAVQRKGIQ